jgi:hypothetical protein
MYTFLCILIYIYRHTYIYGDYNRVLYKQEFFCITNYFNEKELYSTLYGEYDSTIKTQLQYIRYIHMMLQTCTYVRSGSGDVLTRTYVCSGDVLTRTYTRWRY